MGWLEGRGANKAQEYESKYFAKLEAERQAEEKLAIHHDEVASGIITEPEPTKKESHKKPDEVKKQIGTGTVVILALFFMFFISMNLMILLEAVPIEISVLVQDTLGANANSTETTTSIKTVTYNSASGDVIAARAARVDRDRDPHQTTSARLSHQVAGKLVVSVDLGRARSDVRVGEPADCVAKRLLVGGELESHGVR